MPGSRVGDCRHARNPLHTRRFAPLSEVGPSSGPKAFGVMSGEGEQTREFIEREVIWSGAYLVDAADGTEVGVVDQVLLDGAGRPTRIDVRCGWFGRRLCSFKVDDVVAVYRSGRLLIVSNEAAARRQDAPA